MMNGDDKGDDDVDKRDFSIEDHHRWLHATIGKREKPDALEKSCERSCASLIFYHLYVFLCYTKQKLYIKSKNYTVGASA